ncbi:MAG: methionyl-tRNA formyltransferase [Gammaproteobacteria bacterium]|nr:methionyl-tRNA formyltransferase [Gammaproteobacteria bacterium]
MTESARIVYAGTPEFALPPLQYLQAAGVEISAVYTQPDRKAGRGQILTASPVKHWALDQGLRVEQPESLRDPAAKKQLAAYHPDLMVVTAYGLLLPAEILAIPRCGCVNLHASLLPRWRGAAPIQRAILAGDVETGITLMQMDTGLDTGAILAKETTKIAAGETSAELHERLAELAARLLADKLPQLLDGSLQSEQQQHDLASYAYKIKKEEAWIDWSQTAEQLLCKVSAFNPWPIAQTKWQGQVLRIGRAKGVVSHLPKGVVPGEVIAATEQGIDVACGRGALSVMELQLPGARMISCADFIHAHRICGDKLG